MQILTGILIFLSLFVAALATALYLIYKLFPQWGALPKRSDRQAYARRAANFRRGRFYNEDYMCTPLPDLLPEQSYSACMRLPQHDLPQHTATADCAAISAQDLAFSWLGHSSVLLRAGGQSILIDPIFSERSSPMPFGPRRFTPSVLDAATMPHVDICLITHAHYDHLDYRTISDIADKVGVFVVPLGVERILERWHIPTSRIKSLAWWEELTIGSLSLACTPSRHFSARFLLDYNATLWCSWIIKAGQHKIFHSGDGAYGAHFAKIAERYAPIDLAFMECGQYNKLWRENHLFPEDSVKAAVDLGAAWAVPLHFAVFSLSSHPWNEPPLRFRREAERCGLRCATPLMGECVQYAKIAEFTEKWWET